MLFPAANSQKKWLLFLLISAILLNLYFDSRFEGTIKDRARWIDSAFSRIVFPLQWVWVKTRDFSSVASRRSVEVWSTMEANQKLKEELALKNLRIQELETLESEVLRLRQTLGFRSQSKQNLLPARIIGRDISLFSRSLEIDRGSQDGVVAGMPVVTPQGVVGKIVRPLSYKSTVLLLNDINSRIDGLVERNRIRVIVAGSSEGNLHLKFLPRRFDLKQGDTVVSSGFGGFFPEGYKIGMIVGQAKDPHLVLEQAELEPSVNFDALDEVFIVQTVSRWP